MEVFEDYAYYYNLIYHDKNYANEAEVVSDLLSNQKVKNGKLLNIGCGTGRHDYELNKLGYTLHGIDLSEEMIEIANENYSNSSNLSFEVGDARKYKSSEKYDAVISLFHVMSYQTENQDVLDFLSTASQALNREGILLFDAWYGPGVLTEHPERRIKKVEDAKISVIRFADPVMHFNENIVDVNYDVLVINKETAITQEIREIHRMRYFFLPEMKFFLEQSGFELIKCMDCNELEQPDENSWTVYFIAKKK